MGYYKVFQIDKHTWKIEDPFHSFMYLMEGEKQAALLDTGDGFPGLLGCIRDLTAMPLFVINTHGHLDHIGGNSQLPDTAVYMKREDLSTAEEHMNYKFRKAFIEGFAEEFGQDVPLEMLNEISWEQERGKMRSLEEGQVFDLGGRCLEIIWTPGHTGGSVCVLDREKRALFSADTVCAQGVLLFFEHSASVSDYLQSIRKLKKKEKEYERIWPGHHESPLDLSWIEEYERCALEIIHTPGTGKMIRSNLGSGRIHRCGRIAISYREENIS